MQGYAGPVQALVEQLSQKEGFQRRRPVDPVEGLVEEPHEIQL